MVKHLYPAQFCVSKFAVTFYGNEVVFGLDQGTCSGKMNFRKIVELWLNMHTPICEAYLIQLSCVIMFAWQTFLPIIN